MKKFAVLMAALILSVCLLASCGQAAADTLPGVWRADLPRTVGNGADLELTFLLDEGGGLKCLASSLQLGFRSAPAGWSEADGALRFTLSEENGFPLELSLSLDGEGHLYSREPEVIFVRQDRPAEVGELRFVPVEMTDYSLRDRMEQLMRYPSYSMGNERIPFTYELNNREAIRLLDEEYGFAEAMEGKSDLNAMLAALNCTCNNFPHNGMSGRAPEQTAASIAQFSIQNGGVNCWGLSVLLAEVLRAYGIPAKPVSCQPIEQNSVDTHVVVHAYSASRKQWILLDPTYRLVLTGKESRYLDLPALRQMILDGETPIANPGAGWNGSSFYWEDYRAYMAKNCFRFASPIDAYSGNASTPTLEGYAELVPDGYLDPLNKGLVVSDPDAFWALPEGE